MNNIVNLIGFVSCGLLIYAWIESKISRGNRKSSNEDEKKLQAMKDLQFAVSEHVKSKK